MKKNNNTKEELITKIESWFLSQGYPLEMDVADQFLNRGYQVNLSSYYLDFESKKSREIDIIATKTTDNKQKTILQVCYNIE